MKPENTKTVATYIQIAPYWDYMLDIAWVLFALLAAITPWDSIEFLKLCIVQIVVNLYFIYRSFAQRNWGAK